MFKYLACVYDSVSEENKTKHITETEIFLVELIRSFRMFFVIWTHKRFKPGKRDRFTGAITLRRAGMKFAVILKPVCI